MRSMGTKVIVAMSGGVDSSVAAALLKERGYEVIGITMSLACSSKASDKGCCSMSAANDAKRVAETLGISHYTLNFKDDFKRLVIENFIEEYKKGRTPNPCIRCNQYIKFDLLLKKARELGAEFVATGHYARKEIGKLGDRDYVLLKGKDPKKDQSYVLYRLNQESLVHALFPLGELTKAEVRKLARKFKLPVHDKKESQEICFIEDDNYVRFLKEVCPESVKPGPILDKQGNIVGMHGGIAFYTIGQRKGIGAHRGNAKYVIRINREQNAIVIGDREDLFSSELIAEQISFVSGEIPSEPVEVTAKIRYNSPEEKAIIYPEHGTQSTEHKAQVRFKRPQRAITPGQSVVFYREDEVVGGGVISQVCTG